MGLTIREARPEEYEAIADVTLAAYAPFPETGDDPEYVAEQRDVAGRAQVCPIYVAVDDETGAVLGVATYVPGPDNPWSESERDGEAGIRMLAVAPTARRGGIGTALTNALVERARREGKRGVALLTLPAMTAAQRMYERLGFERAPDRDWEYQPGSLLIGYVKKLDE